MINVVCSRKGGVGKSTVACNMAAILANEGRRVAIIERDPQGTAMNWASYRSEIEGLVPIAAFPIAAGKKMLASIKDLSLAFDDLVIDFQGVDSEENRFVLTLADRVILPFKASQPDLDTIPWTKEMLGQLVEINEGVKTYYIINEAPTNTRTEAAEALTYFQNFELTPIRTILHSRKAYRDSMATGRGTVELGDEKAKAEMRSVYEDIFC